MENLSLLTTELSLNYVNVRQNLEAATSVAKQQVDVQTKAAADSHADSSTEQKKHEERAGDPADQGRPAPDRQRQEGDRRSPT